MFKDEIFKDEISPIALCETVNNSDTKANKITQKELPNRGFGFPLEWNPIASITFRKAIWKMVNLFILYTFKCANMVHQHCTMLLLSDCVNILK